LKVTDGSRVYECEVREITPHPLEPLIYDKTNAQRPPLAALLYCEALAGVKENIELKWVYDHPNGSIRDHAESRMVVVRRGGYIGLSQRMDGLGEHGLPGIYSNVEEFSEGLVARNPTLKGWTLTPLAWKDDWDPKHVFNITARGSLGIGIVVAINVNGVNAAVYSAEEGGNIKERQDRQRDWIKTTAQHIGLKEVVGATN
jgi:hypothetical protein